MNITNNLIDQFWPQNLVHMFGSPLTVNEWISAAMLLGSFVALLGFFTAAFIMYGRMRVHWATWAMSAAMSPFIAIYYPIEILPKWCQVIGTLLPPTYVFQGMRRVIIKGIVPWSYLGISLLLNALYLTLAVLFFKYMFEKSKMRELSRVE
jgi:ABC-2 type transport system permease protein